MPQRQYTKHPLWVNKGEPGARAMDKADLNDWENGIYNAQQTANEAYALAAAGGGGGGGITVTDNGDGTLTLTGSDTSVIDNGDGTLTLN